MDNFKFTNTWFNDAAKKSMGKINFPNQAKKRSWK